MLFMLIRNFLKKNRVYYLTSQIPKGKVSTYGHLAKAMRKPNATRTIGKILNINPNPVIIPCHRVVYADGEIGGYCNGINEKIELLSTEGIIIVNRKITNFKDILFTDFK